MADDSEAFPGRESRKRVQPAWMQEHENDSDEDVDEEEEKVRRAPKKPKAKAAPKMTVTLGPRKPAESPRKPADNKGRKDAAKDNTTKEERALMARYTQLRALKDAQASSVGDTNAQSAEQAQNDQRMAAAVAALRQDTQTDERKPAARKLPSMRRSNVHAAPDAVNFRDAREEQLEQLNGPQLELGALWGGQAPVVETEEI